VTGRSRRAAALLLVGVAPLAVLAALMAALEPGTGPSPRRPPATTGGGR
jgi:hypothetical protein